MGERHNEKEYRREKIEKRERWGEERWEEWGRERVREEWDRKETENIDDRR